MNIDSIIREHEDSIISLSEKIYGFAELGSSEYKSSALVIEGLKKEGFTVTNPYMGMDTAFRAEYGDGTPVAGLLMEYDALPNGHSCGHNLISAWAYGTAITVKNMVTSGKVIVFGTPSEEGIGPYAGSKARMATAGAFRDIDFVIGMHPDDIWAVGSKALADMRLCPHECPLGRASYSMSKPTTGVPTPYSALKAANPQRARGELLITISVASRTIVKIMENKHIMNSIKSEFDKHGKS